MEHSGVFIIRHLRVAGSSWQAKKPKLIEAEYTFNNLNYYRTGSFLFVNTTPSYLYENNTYFRIDMGFPITYKGKLETGFTVGSNRSDYFQTNTPSTEDQEDRTKFGFLSP